MLKLTAEQIQSNYNKLIEIINFSFKDNVDRRDKLLKLCDDFGVRFAVAPASSINHFHGSYEGGLVEHILTVMKIARKLYKLWGEMGGNLKGYTLENLDFVCLTHDFGKLGNSKYEFYKMNEDAWQVKNQKKNYVTDANLQQMDHSWRSIYLLNQYGITMSEQEFLAIMAHDGAFKDENKNLFTCFEQAKLPKTNLLFLLHISDLMSYRIEIEKEGIVNPLEIEL